MKNLFKKIFVVLAVIATTSGTVNFLNPEPVSAANRSFLGLTTWDYGTGFFNDDGTPKKLTEDKLKKGIWVAVANVATDIGVIATYLAIGFVIYGGYRYMFSAGDPGKVATGKKTLLQAFIGLAIATSAGTIMGAIRIALMGESRAGNFGHCVTTGGCISASNMVNELITWVIGVAGIISVIFVVYGGITYITSRGDPGKVQKAKSAILYSVIGLIICALALIITGFMSQTIRNANTNPFIKDTIISKEAHEIT